MWTQPERFSYPHAGADAESAGFIRTGDNAAAAHAIGDGDRVAEQQRKVALLDGGEEGVHVDEYDSALPVLGRYHSILFVKKQPLRAKRGNLLQAIQLLKEIAALRSQWQNSLFTIHYSLFTIHYSLFTIHYSLFTGFLIFA
jgi:hypothetical protein